MDEEKKEKLEAKLRRMLMLNEKTAADQAESGEQPDSGNIIRRRKGQKDKRIALLEKKTKLLHAES